MHTAKIENKELASEHNPSHLQVETKTTGRNESYEDIEDALIVTTFYLPN